MLSTFGQSLRFQIIAALLTMLVVFAISQTLTLFALEEQLNNQVILNLASRLQLFLQRRERQGLGDGKDHEHCQQRSNDLKAQGLTEG